MSRAELLAIGLVLSPFLCIAGQGERVLAPGDRVRLTTRSALRIVGTLVAADRDSLRVQQGSAPGIGGRPTIVAIARGSIVEAAVGVPSQSHAGVGADIGALVGVLGGAAFGATDAANCNSRRQVCLLSPGEEAFSVALVLGAVGTVVGAGIGFIIRSPGWERVALEHARATVSSRGAGLALSFAF
jgi:hypothetical protein